MIGACQEYLHEILYVLYSKSLVLYISIVIQIENTCFNFSQNYHISGKKECFNFCLGQFFRGNKGNSLETIKIFEL